MNEMERANKILDDEIKEDRFDAAKGIVVTGWLLLIVMSVGIVGSTIYFWIAGRPVPETLENWGSMVLGFLFGTFISLLKDFINGKNTGTG